MSPIDAQTLAMLEANYSHPMGVKAQPKKKGKGGILTSLISEGGAIGGGAAGAAAGTALLPGVGTLLGGALGAGIGAFTGRVAENKVRDDRYGFGDAAKEGLVSGLLSAPGKGIKAGYTGAKTLAKGGGLEEALLQAGTKATKSGLVGRAANKVRTGAADRSAAGFGVKTTDKFLPDDADAVAQFIQTKASKYAPVKAGSPLNQARDLQGVKNGVVKQLDAALEGINRPLKPNETKAIITSLDNRLVNNPDITGNTELANKFKTLVINKDIKGIEKLRRQYDDIAFKANGDPATTAKAAEAGAIRDTIDEFVTPLSKEYKSIKGDYGLANKALQLASKEGGKQAKGLPVPFMGGGITNNGIAGNSVATVRNKVNASLAGNGGLGKAGDALASPAAAGARMGVTGNLADALFNAQQGGEQPQADEYGAPDATGMDSMAGLDGASQESQSPYSREALLADVQRDPENAEDYFKLYEQYQSVFAAPEGAALTSSQQTRAAAAQNALLDFPLIEQAISSGQLGAAKALPGSGTQVGRRLLGTEDLDAALFNIADNILRARSGAAAPEAEVLRFKNTFLPGPLDSDEAKRSKLERAMRELQGYVNPQGAAAGSSSDLADALMQAGYQ